MNLPKISLTWKILIGLVIGIFVGWLLPEWGLEARPLSNLFLNLIKSVIAPLIFATLVVGISGTGDIKQVGRIGGKSLLYFEVVTTLALFIGLAAVNITQPGKGVSLAEASKSRVKDKAELAKVAKGLSDEALEALKKADAFTAENNPVEAAKHTTIASQKAAEAAKQANASGIT
jgi:proton glutamate symport protein